MSVIRTLGKVVGAFLFSFFLTLAVTLVSLSQLTEHNTLKTLTTDLIESQIPANQSAQEFSAINSACQSRDSIEISSPLLNLTFRCSELLTAKSPVEMSRLIASKLFDTIYFKNYSCGFIECIQQSGELRSIVIISSLAHDFFKSIQDSSWIGVAIGAIILIVACESWGERFKKFGYSLILLGIPFVVIYYLKGLFLSSVNLAALNNIINIIFDSMLTNFILISIAGVALAIAGYFITKIERKEKSTTQQKQKTTQPM